MNITEAYVHAQQNRKVLLVWFVILKSYHAALGLYILSVLYKTFLADFI